MIPSQDAAAPIVNALLLPLYFLSGIFIPDDELPDGVINFANHFPIRDFFQAFFNAYLPGGASGARLGQPRRGRDLGRRRPAARDPLLPLDPARRLSAEVRRLSGRPVYSLPVSMLHHVLLEVSDLDRSAAFYDSMLAPLGWRRHFEEDETIGWGIAKPVFFIAAHHEPKPGFGLLSFSGLGIVAVKAAWERGDGGRGRQRQRPWRAALARLRLLLGVPQGPGRVRDRDHHRVRLSRLPRIGSTKRIQEA